MNYIDLHCDTVTRCADAGVSLYDGEVMSGIKKLRAGGCASQCFAIFTEGADWDKFAFYLNFYKEQLKKYEDKVLPVTCRADLLRAKAEDKIGAVLTVENLGFLHGRLDGLDKLKSAGVKMASLVWNYENELASPNIIFEGGIPQFEKRCEKGLSKLGREAVSLLDKNKIIVDISHLSDGGAEEILAMRKIPTVASHSNAAAVCNVSRNLTDRLIKKIADCGGVIGVNFCRDFCGHGDIFTRLSEHISRLIDVGGEDVVALGSDFDGIPEVQGLEDATKIPELFNRLNMCGLKAGTLEKLAHENFGRVFADVCG